MRVQRACAAGGGGQELRLEKCEYVSPSSRLRLHERAGLGWSVLLNAQGEECCKHAPGGAHRGSTRPK